MSSDFPFLKCIILSAIGALDYNTGKQILKLLQDTCRKENMTVIIITHNTAITPMADKVIHFKNGTAEKDYKYSGFAASAGIGPNHGKRCDQFILDRQRYRISIYWQ
jgi:energy-coupling factor transporter ATP-binding protein EcfA2